MKTTVIVTTYNRPAALELCLLALARQTVLPSEVIVADDGSKENTGELVARLKLSVPYVLKHVWQEDQGFRAAAVRNRAVSDSEGDYLIFIDGDCLASKNFLANHIRLSEKGRFVTGNRILLSEKYTLQLECRADVVPHWGLGAAVFQRLFGNFNRVLPMLCLPGGAWRNMFLTKRWQGAKTCNLAAFRDDFVKINGFDERYEGWGHEDADLVVRFFSSGISRKDGRWGTVVFHLWHKENDRSLELENRKKLDSIINNGVSNYYAKQGISRYLISTKG